MKKRFMSMLLVLCMVFTLFPSAVFAEEAGGATIGNTAIGTSSVTEGAPLCENHKVHDKDCGYIEAKDAQPCGDLLEDGIYSCAPVKDSGDVSGNTATPGNAEEKYVCDHSDGCGYKEAVDGADCTHECELCKDVVPALLSTPRTAITGTGYSYDPNSKTLTISSDAATTAWRSDSNITKANVTKVVIESGVTEIGTDAFYGCNELTSVTIPSSVTTIGNSAFFACSNLASVTIREGVTTIGDTAFAYCTSLASVTIPEGVTTIGDNTFNACSNLASVTFEGATPPTTFGSDVFAGTHANLKIYVPSASVQDYKDVANLAACASIISPLWDSTTITAASKVFPGDGVKFSTALPGNQCTLYYLKIDSTEFGVSKQLSGASDTDKIVPIDTFEDIMGENGLLGTVPAGKKFSHWQPTDTTVVPENELKELYLKAVFVEDSATVTEQFTLATGETYYFDLSGELGTVTNGVSSTIGTINVGRIGSNSYPGVPDPTMHYVPFTYAGTVNAYSLDSSSSGQTGSSAAATASDRSLFVAEYNVSHTKSWDGLNTASLIFGKTLDTNYKLRSMSAGSSRSVDGSASIGAPATNEWDSILTKSSEYIKNYKNIFSCGQDTTASNSANRTVRGSGSVLDYYLMSSSGVTYSCGFRPALEVLNPTTLTSDGLKAVTLNLNGGSFDSNGSEADGVVSSLNIVCAGATFNAPSGEGLTPPSGKAFDKWSTAADGNGTSYAVGASVPNSVAALYAQWKDVAPTTKITKTLNLLNVSADVKCTDINVETIITGQTTHTHADNKPCWAWNNATSTLTLNNVDIEVSVDDEGIVLPKVAATILFSGSNTVKADIYGIFCDRSLTLTGESNSASLNISVNSQPGIYFNNSLIVTEGIVNVTSERYYAIISSSSSPSINLSGGTVTAKGGIGKSPFWVEPTLSNGMVHKDGTGTWDNTTGTACVYEKGAAATVTAVAVTPETASVQKGTTQQFNATVTGTNNPAQTVTWAVTGGTKSTINESGLLTVAADETATSLTVKATSTVDTTKSDTAAVTVTTTPVTKYTLTVTNGTGGGNFEENATVTITANAPATGKVFDKWTTTDGVTFGDANAATTTITMPAKAVTVTATYKDEAVTVPVTGVTLNKSTISLYSNTNPRSETLTATVAPSNATNKAVAWSSSNPAVATVANGTVTAVANGTATITVTTADGGFTASCTVAVSTYSSGGSTGGGGGGSSSGGSSNIIVTPPALDKPNTPTEAQIKVEEKTDASGNTTITVTDKNITDAIAKAEADAKKNGNTANGVTIVLSATGGKNAQSVTVNLPKTVQDTIISKKVVSTIIVVDNPDVQIGMDLKAVAEINRQAKSDVNISAKRLDSGKLTGTAKTAIGSRPVFNLTVDYGSGKQVQSFGAGSVSVAIPYTLGVNEKSGNVCAVYVDGSGKVQWLTSSVYDSAAKVLRFSTNHFSTYGVGYKQDVPAFTDTQNHWAKADIEYVVSRGLFSGTGATTFSPNTAMTRGMFVTALGRLANADVSSYKTSSFSDVKADSYYMGYIEWANKNGIVNGSDGKFMPDQSITREQMAVIMQNYAKVIGFTLPKVHEEKAFADSDKIGGYAKDAVKAMQMAGVLSGKSGNVFDPQGTATRAEVSAVLRRFVELRISIDTAQGWTMNDSGKWMYYEGGKPITGKKDIGGVSYTFDQNGEMADVPKNLKYTTHTVIKNESWGLIAKKYGCSASELARVNNKTVFDVIHPGDVLKVPQK